MHISSIGLSPGSQQRTALTFVQGGGEAQRDTILQLIQSKLLCACVSKNITFGQLFRLTLNLWYALPAFSSGFSVRPPPATWPTIARHVLGSTYGGHKQEMLRFTLQPTKLQRHHVEQQCMRRAFCSHAWFSCLIACLLVMAVVMAEEAGPQSMRGKRIGVDEDATARREVTAHRP